MFHFPRRLLKVLLFNSILVLTSAGLYFDTVHAVKTDPNEERLEMQRAMPIQSNEILNWPVGPVVSADSAILMEADTGTVLYAKNIHQKEYPASTTKILTTLIAVENCSLNEVITFSHDAVFDNPPGSSGIAMDVGQTLTLEQCLNAILIRSANEVCFAVAEHITGTTDWSEFAKIMNARAQELGALNSNFVNPNGLPDENHYTTAYDLAMIGRGFFANEMLCDISLSKRLEIPASDTIPEAKIENNAMQIIPGGKYAYEYLIGCKTGYTNDARSCLVSAAEKNGMKLICVVMKEESPLQYEDTISLFDYGFSNFDKVNVSQHDKRYQIGNTGNFYDGNDIFGNSKPLLTLNRSDAVIVPKTLSLEELSSTISFETQNPELAALIRYQYRDIPLGTVRVEFTNAETESYSFESIDDAPKQENSVIFINIVRILIGLAVIAGILFLYTILKILLRNFSFSGSRRRQWKKNQRIQRRNTRKYQRRNRRNGPSF